MGEASLSKRGLITIDGAVGEGGGQILRTSLGLALVLNRPVRITNIRAGRAKPGLLRQHLTCVEAAVKISRGSADGAEIGSGEVVFRPSGVFPGRYAFAVGTAGSTTLVLQTVLPALCLAAAPSSLALSGGTHNPAAPPFDFISEAFLPVLAQFGPRVKASLTCPGFYPAGGGALEVEIEPCRQFSSISLLERGAAVDRQVVAHLAGVDPSCAERAFTQIEKRLGWPRDRYRVENHSGSRGPGFVLTASVFSESNTEVFTAFGEKGTRAESVADDLVDQVRGFLKFRAPVGEHLADQLLIPMALAGAGVFRTGPLSLHATTNISVIEQFLETRFSVSRLDDGLVEVRL